jgi:hypothetical protein
MPKQQKPIKKPETEPEEVEEEEAVRPRNSGEETLQEFFGNFEDIYSVSIWQLDSATGRWMFRATASHDVVTEEYLQNRFRGGQYKLQLRSQKGLLGTKTQINIADPVEERPQPAAAAAPGTGAAAAGGFDLFSIMQAQTQRQHELMIAMIQRERPAGAGLAEMLPLLKLMQAAPQTTLADQLETLKSLRELTGDAGGGDGGDFMKDLRGLLMPLLVAKLAGGRGAAGKLPAAAAETEADDMRAVIVKAIQNVKPAALAGADPITMARLAISYAERDPDTLDFLSDLAEQRFPVVLQLLGQYDAELTREPLASWLGIFHEALSDELRSAPDSERGTGNAGDAAAHGAPGEGRSTLSNHSRDNNGTPRAAG